MRTLPIIAALAALALSACQTYATQDAAAAAKTTTGMPPATTATEVPGATPVERGLAFAEYRCAACHAVAPGEVSSNPDSPTFEMVANTPGLSEESLSSWLHNSHDFPAEMYFAIADENIDDLVAYMLTLRRADYKPPIQ